MIRRAVGFDLDDTLYDHSMYVLGAYRDIAVAVEKIAGIPKADFFERIFSDWQKLTSRCNTIFSNALAAWGIYSPQLENYLVQIYRAHVPRIELFPGVLDGLRSLKEAGFLLGILSDGRPEVQRRKLHALGLEGMFDAEVFAGNPNFYKPDSSGFQRLIGLLGVEPMNMTYVGDNPFTDFEPAKRLGIKTIRVLIGEYRHRLEGMKWVDLVLNSGRKV